MLSAKWLTLLSVAAVATTLFSQTNQTSQTNPPIPPLSNQYASGSVGAGFFPLNPSNAIVTGEPFHAEINARRIKLQPDGKQIVYESHDLVARDSDGRFYQEHLASPFAMGPNGGSTTPHDVRIFDPVAMIQLRWVDVFLPSGVPPNAADRLPLYKTVLKSPLDPNRVSNRKALRLSACDGDHPSIRTYPNNSDTQHMEDLGDRTIQGFSTRGCRVTTEIKGDPALNKEPDTITEESWTSADLRMILLRTRQDPRSGEDEIIQLDNIMRGAPDPKLFLPPADYRVTTFGGAAPFPLAGPTIQPQGMSATVMANDPTRPGGILGQVASMDGVCSTAIPRLMRACRRTAVGAVVLVREINTKQITAATTGDDGSYRFDQLPAGSYEISAQKPQMKAAIRPAVALADGATLVENLTLEYDDAPTQLLQAVSTVPNNLRMLISLDPQQSTKSKAPGLRVDISNTGSFDVNVTLDIPRCSPSISPTYTIALVLTDLHGTSHHLEYLSKASSCAGLLGEPYVLQLPAGATFSVPVNLDDYAVSGIFTMFYHVWHAGETYSLQAKLTIDGRESSGVLAKSNELQIRFPDN